MNKNINTICREIRQGNLLETNIPNFFNRLVTLYEQYARINLTMNYYTFYENQIEASYVKSKSEVGHLEEINHIIKEYILSEFSGKKLEEGIKKIDGLRNIVMQEMKILTSYTDIFLVYEYVLERVKYRFYESMDTMEDEEFISEVIRYIFEVNDNVLINDKIKEILGELPVRMTKSKFLDLIRDSLSIYKGGDKTSLDSYLYMIETAATIYEPAGMKASYENLARVKEEFSQLDFTNITKEQYDIFRDKFEHVTMFISDRVNFYYGLQEIINNAYVVLLTTPYAFMDGGYRIEGIEEMKYLIFPPDKKDICREILSNINGLFEGSSTVDLEETESLLSNIEGIQEDLFERILPLESTLDEIGTSYENLVASLMLTPIYESLRYSQNLISNSLFVELNSTIVNHKVDEAYLKVVEEQLILKLNELFSKSSKQVMRGIIASTLNKMPVFFHSTNDVMDYIKQSMEQCKDLAEKRASMDIIKNMWED